MTAQPTPLSPPVRRAAVVTHGKLETIGDALDRLQRVADEAGVVLEDADCPNPDVVIVLGGDGTMLRALRSCLDRPAPVFGVNFGRVGFLTSLAANDLETGVGRVFRGEFRVIELCTLAARLNGERHLAVNDIVVASSRPGRMVELEWQVGGYDLGVQPCDGMICATPTGSTAYNLSNGGPVLMWGLEAMAITFVAPHSLHARPLVVPRGLDLRVTSRTPEVAVSVLVDGHDVATLAGPAEIALGGDTGLLALLPEVTFFSRYHETFT